MKELILGSGNIKQKRIKSNGSLEYSNPVTLDISPECNPDVVWNLNVMPLPFENEEFNEIHAYEVLEHVGMQGDWRGFFEEFSEYHRILKPGGYLVASVPRWDSVWAFGDPGHTRVISEGTLAFLNQDEYTNQLGKTSMTDYREVYKVSFIPIFMKKDDDNFYFILEKV